MKSSLGRDLCLSSWEQKFDDDEEATNYDDLLSYLRRIHLSDHDPGHDQIAERAGYDEDVDAGDRDPRVGRLDVIFFPELDVVHVYC